MDELQLLRRRLNREKTARQEAEQLLENKSRELFNINENLDSIVKLRTLELNKARKIAVEANEAKNLFLANICHDLRTPLNAIIGLSEIILNSSHVNSECANIKLINNAGHELLSMIENIIDLTKLESNKLKIVERSLNLKEFVQQILDMIQVSANKKSLELTYNLTDLPKYIKADELRLKQILLNLLSNATKYTDCGTITLSIRVNNSQSQLMFEVKDTGIGIPNNKKHKIFQRFKSLQTNAKAESCSHGLGLSICQSLAELMQGNIKVTDNQPHGSIFILTIPLKIAYSQEKIKKSKRIANDNFSMNVLVVDDNDANLLVAQGYLKLFNCQVSTATNVNDAMSIFTSHTFDIIFTDLYMDELDGIDLTKKIRNIDKNIPIIVVSASVHEQDRENCINVGVNSFIKKPYDKKQIYALLKRYSE